MCGVVWCCDWEKSGVWQLLLVHWDAVVVGYCGDCFSLGLNTSFFMIILEVESVPAVAYRDFDVCELVLVFFWLCLMGATLDAPCRAAVVSFVLLSWLWWWW